MHSPLFVLRRVFRSRSAQAILPTRTPAQATHPAGPLVSLCSSSADLRLSTAAGGKDVHTSSNRSRSWDRLLPPSPVKTGFCVLLLSVWTFLLVAPAKAAPASIQKLEDLVIYRDDRFHCAFPSIVRTKDGAFLLAFRRAPDRRVFGGRETWHVDPNSYLVTLRSQDGVHWPKEPELLYAHPLGGSQDPCLLALNDGSLLCSSYGWALLRPDEFAKLTPPNSVNSKDFVFMGGFLLKSADLGRSWALTPAPPVIEGEFVRDPFGQLLRPFDRGAMCQDASGTIFWAVVRHDHIQPTRSSMHLLASTDQGQTWNYRCLIAEDSSISFGETSLYLTAKGDLVAFIRTANHDGKPVIARSTDGGKSFGRWEDMGFVAEPLQATRVGEKGVLLTYGYRRPPFGIRARLLNPDCTDFTSAPEVILREDGGGVDLGYPWSIALPDGKFLVCYYLNQGNGPRHIAGTIVDVR